MIDSQPERYQLPDNSDGSVARMLWGLVAFFVFLVVLVVLVFWNAQSLARLVPFGAEQRFFRPYEELIARLFPAGLSDPDVSDALQALSDGLRAPMKVPEDIQVRMHFVDSDEVNAFATLGGHVVVFRGLVEKLPDENSLAMVIAHEMAHVANRDPVASMGRGFALQMIFGFITGGGATSAENLVELAGGSGFAVFSREQERVADLAALRGIYEYYGHVGGYRTFFEQMLEEEQSLATSDGDDIDVGIEDPDLAWLSSHPGTADRLLYLDEARASLGAEIGSNRELPAALSAIVEASEHRVD